MSTKPSLRQDRPRLGILLYLLTGLCFCGIDVSAKLAVEQDYSVWQVSWVRFAVAAVMMLALRLCTDGIRAPGRLIAASRPGLQVVRGLCQLGTSVLFYFSFTYLPLADALAIGFVAPLIVTAVSGPLLGEKAGTQNWVAVACGFAGVLVIMRPGFAGFQWPMLLALATAFVNAGLMILTRVVGRYDTPAVSSLYGSVVSVVLLSIIAPFAWTTPTLSGLAFMLSAGVFGALAHYFMAAAFVRASATTLAAYAYVQLIWETAGGYFFFDEFPDVLTIIGGLIVVGSGVYLFTYEARRTRTSS